jgi:flagellar protein FlaJ
MYFEKNLRMAVWAVSATVGILVMLSPFLFGLYMPKAPYIIPLSQRVNNAITFGFIIIFAFPAFIEYSNHRWVRQIEQSIPRLLRDISEAVRSGVILPKAVEDAAKKGYGALSKELERVMTMFVLGATWEEAVTSMSKRTKSATVARFATILVEANGSGGKVSEVIDMSVELFSNLDEYKEEQLNNMKPYLYTIYASIAIFLIISFVVLSQFLVPLTSTTKVATAPKPNSIANVLDINYYASILFWASIVESFFAGFIAGKIGDRCYSAGLRHSVLLSVISVIFFNFAGVFW